MTAAIPIVICEKATRLGSPGTILSEPLKGDHICHFCGKPIKDHEQIAWGVDFGKTHSETRASDDAPDPA